MAINYEEIMSMTSENVEVSYTCLLYTSDAADDP